MFILLLLSLVFAEQNNIVPGKPAANKDYKYIQLTTYTFQSIYILNKCAIKDQISFMIEGINETHYMQTYFATNDCKGISTYEIFQLKKNEEYVTAIPNHIAYQKPSYNENCGEVIDNFLQIYNDKCTEFDAESLNVTLPFGLKPYFKMMITDNVLQVGLFMDTNCKMPISQSLVDSILSNYNVELPTFTCGQCSLIPSVPETNQQQDSDTTTKRETNAQDPTHIKTYCSKFSEDSNSQPGTTEDQFKCNIALNQNVLTLSGCETIIDSTKLDTARNTATKVIISEGIKTIETNSFKNFNKMEEIIIGKDVNQIKENAFTGCTFLKTVSYQGNKEPTCPETLFKSNTNVKTVAVTKEYQTQDNNFCGTTILRADSNNNNNNNNNNNGTSSILILIAVVLLMTLF